MRATRLVAGQLARASSRSLLCHAPRPALRSSLPSSCSSSTSKLLDTSSTLPIPLPSWPEHQQLRFASKKKKNSKSKKASKFEEDDDEVEVEDLPVPIVAKGKKGKAAQVTEEDITAEKFDLDKLGKSMDEAVERFQVDSRVVLARVEKLSPSEGFRLILCSNGRPALTT